MSTESKTPETDNESVIESCRTCGVQITTNFTLKERDHEGNYTGVSISLKKCLACGTEAERRMVESKIREAQAKARYEKSLADLIASIPKPKHEQAELDMGLD